MNQRLQVTLDNNCVINLFDANSSSATSVEELEELIRLGLSGAAEIAITTRVEADLEQDTNSERRSALMKQIRMFPVVGTVARWNTSKWDRGDMWGSAETARIADELQKILFPGGLDRSKATYPNKLNDIDHLLGHFINGRDIFVTDDKGILRKRDQLRQTPGLVAMSPADCVEQIHNIIDRHRTRPLQSQNRYPGYHSKALQGTVRFDYSNNNGRFVIGEGVYLFETMWTKASRDAIHAYNDADSIDSVALVKGVEAISGVSDASKYDYTSRVRTVSEGDILLIRNANKFYAAIKVLDVTADDRGDERDGLEFEYVIQTDGAGDFTKA